MYYVIGLVWNLLFALFGLNRKMGYWWSLFFCLCFTPIIGLIITLCGEDESVPIVAPPSKKRKIWGVILIVLGGISIFLCVTELAQAVTDKQIDLIFSIISISIGLMGGGFYLRKGHKMDEMTIND